MPDAPRLRKRRSASLWYGMAGKALQTASALMAAGRAGPRAAGRSRKCPPRPQLRPGAGPNTRLPGRPSPRRPAPRSLSTAQANSLCRQMNAEATGRSGDRLPVADPAPQAAAATGARRSELRPPQRSSDVSGRTPSRGLSRAPARGRGRGEPGLRVPGRRGAGDGLGVGKAPGALSASSLRAPDQRGFGKGFL